MQNIFGTGTMRSGGSLVLSIMEIYKNTKTLCEIFYFSHHIYKKYGNYFSNEVLYKLSGELSLRLYFRNGIKISHKQIFNYLKKFRIKNYNNVYNVLSKLILNKLISQNQSIKNFVDYSNGEWRFVKDFLNLNKKNKSFIVMRDPRSVFSSFKKLTFNKNFSYLNCVFNWIDCAQYYFHYKKKYKMDKFLPLIFENIHLEPKNNVKKICKFLNVGYKKEYLENKSFKKIKDKNLIMSAYSTRNVYGFNIKRNNNWKAELQKWEIYFIEKVCHKYMKKLNYNFIFSKKETKYEKIIRLKINKNKIIKQRYANFLKYKKGTNLRTNDPSNPKNWTSRHSNTKFIKDAEYKIFTNNQKKVNQNYKVLKKIGLNKFLQKKNVFIN